MEYMKSFAILEFPTLLRNPFYAIRHFLYSLKTSENH